MQALPTCRVSALPWPSQLVAGPGGGRCSRRNQHQPGTALSSPCLQQRVGRATTTTARSALSPPQAFAADVALHGVLLPVVAGWLLVTSLRTIAGRARQVREVSFLAGVCHDEVLPSCHHQTCLVCCHDSPSVSQWCEANPDEPLSMELLGLLPAALEQPTRLAVLLFVTTRVLRNLVAGERTYGVRVCRWLCRQGRASVVRPGVGWCVTAQCGTNPSCQPTLLVTTQARTASLMRSSLNGAQRQVR
jgi:hypothetical protein